MPRVDKSIIMHRLAVDPSMKLVQQKKRYLSSDQREFIKKEISTHLIVDHVREVEYPKWLANVELAPKLPTW